MSVCDVNEDVVSLAAGIVIKLLRQPPNLDPYNIGRIYVGTESRTNGAKPLASYICHQVSEYYTQQGGNCYCCRYWK